MRFAPQEFILGSGLFGQPMNNFSEANSIHGRFVGTQSMWLIIQNQLGQGKERNALALAEQKQSYLGQPPNVLELSIIKAPNP